MRPIITFKTHLPIEYCLPIVKDILKHVAKKLDISTKVHVSNLPETIVESKNRILNVLCMDYESVSRLETSLQLFRHLNGKETFHIYLERYEPQNGGIVQLNYRSKFVYNIHEENILAYLGTGRSYLVTRKEIIKNITQTFKGHF